MVSQSWQFCSMVEARLQQLSPVGVIVSAIRLPAYLPEASEEMTSIAGTAEIAEFTKLIMQLLGWPCKFWDGLAAFMATLH